MNRFARFARRKYAKLWSRIHWRLVPRFLPKAYSPGILSLHIQLTYTCNLRCWFCGQWGTSGTFKSLSASELRKMVPLEVLTRVIDELPASCLSIFLWGGETLNYPQVIPLIRHIKESGKNCYMVTNGTALAQYAPDLVAAHADLVTVSIDALEEIHDKYRGARGTYRTAIEGIRALAKERGRARRGRPLIYVGIVLLPETAEELPLLLQEARGAGADRAFLGRLQYTVPDQGRMQEATFQKLFGIGAPSWKGIERDGTADGAARIKGLVERIRSDPTSKGFVVWETPKWRPEDYLRYYQNPLYTFPTSRTCRFPWDQVNLRPNGDVSPCPDFPDYVVGNVHQQSFHEIWNGEPFRRFRDELARQGRFPICASCCQLYE
jgi:radical SAM protein with 4Fe4S-binding SPASM domain